MLGSDTNSSASSSVGMPSSPRVPPPVCSRYLSTRAHWTASHPRLVTSTRRREKTLALPTGRPKRGPAVSLEAPSSSQCQRVMSWTTQALHRGSNRREWQVQSGLQPALAERKARAQRDPWWNDAPWWRRLPRRVVSRFRRSQWRALAKGPIKQKEPALRVRGLDCQTVKMRMRLRYRDEEARRAPDITLNFVVEKRTRRFISFHPPPDPIECPCHPVREPGT